MPDELLSTLAQHAALADNNGKISHQALDALRHSGCLGTITPPTYGGLGQDILQANRILERIAMVNASIAIILFQHFAVTARIME